MQYLRILSFEISFICSNFIPRQGPQSVTDDVQTAVRCFCDTESFAQCMMGLIYKACGQQPDVCAMTLSRRVSHLLPSVLVRFILASQTNRKAGLMGFGNEPVLSLLSFLCDSVQMRLGSVFSGLKSFLTIIVGLGEQVKVNKHCVIDAD